VPPSSPLDELFRFLDNLHQRVERMWWGAVVTDPRFPLLWEANYAAVETADPDLSLGEVREVLRPALREAGATHEHIWILQPQAAARLLGDLAAEGQPLHWDDLMRHGPGVAVPVPTHAVEEVEAPDDAFWKGHRLALREFGITESPVVEQLQRWHREVTVPAGKRWFTAHDAADEGPVAGLGSMFVHGDAAYIDDVVTFPPFRRRGVARSVVAAMLWGARAAEATETYLFADQPGPVRLYEELGFEVVERVATSLAALPRAQPRRAGPPAPAAPSRHAAPAGPGGSGPGRPR
jgi:GNAT superfamily N-acetyltransferase